MKNTNNGDLRKNWPGRVLGDLLRRVLNRPEALHMIAPGGTGGMIEHGHHSHDAWELFCPLRGGLSFAVQGEAPRCYPAGNLLIVRPGVLHMAIDRISQAGDLKVLILNLPSAETPGGTLFFGPPGGGRRVGLSPAELPQWQALMGDAPGAIVERAARALDGGAWGRERALAYLRLLVAGYAETMVSGGGRRTAGQRKITLAVELLQTRYFEADLGIGQVAARVGLSPSHLTALFREATGQTPHQALLDIRLRRAAELLAGGTQSIKEIAARTGWNSQLYFSTAFKRRYGLSPSAWRQQQSTTNP